MEVYRTTAGYAEYMYTKENGDRLYRIIYTNKDKPNLWTNSIDIVKSSLTPKNGQLLLFK